MIKAGRKLSVFYIKLSKRSRVFYAQISEYAEKPGWHLEKYLILNMRCSNVNLISKAIFIYNMKSVILKQRRFGTYVPGRFFRAERITKKAVSSRTPAGKPKSRP